MIDWTTLMYDAQRLADAYESSRLTDIIERLERGERSRGLYLDYCEFYECTKAFDRCAEWSVAIGGKSLECNIVTMYYTGEGTQFIDEDGVAIPNPYDYITPNDLLRFQHFKQDMVVHKSPRLLVELFYPDHIDY